MNENSNDIEFNILLKKIFLKRFFLIKTLIVFMLIGISIALLSENRFTAETVFIPQLSDSQTQGSVSGGLGNLASLAGLSLDGKSGNDFPPSLYPRIIRNANFQLSLLSAPLVMTNGDTLTYRQYFSDVYKPGKLHLISKYTIGLPGLLISSLKKSGDPIEAPDRGLIQFNPKDKQLIDGMMGQINVSPNVGDGYVEISFEMPDPYLAAQMVATTQNLLNKELTKYKVNKIEAELSFLEDRYNERKIEFEKIQSQLAEFRDNNQQLNTAFAKNEIQMLENKYELALSIFKNLSKQVEDTKIQIAKDTPLMTTIQPITIPLTRSSPNRVLIVFMFLFAGLGFGIVRVLLADWFYDLRITLKS